MKPEPTLRQLLEASWRAWQRMQELGGVEARLAVPSLPTRAGELLSVYPDARVALSVARDVLRHLEAVVHDEEKASAAE